jgi:undecaprenyl-phosphate 4-deoxy-4-formamido-L-arabinose transferase
MVDSLSVVVPVFASEGALPLLVERLAKVLPTVTDRYELILVNDGSPDDSWSAVRHAVALHPWVRGICLARNYGQHSALLCGIRAARHDVIVTLDDDLQNPPEEIPRLLNALAAGAEVVYGTPRAEQHGLLRDLASQVTKMVLRGAMGADTARSISPFRAFHTEIRRAFDRLHAPSANIDVLLTWGARRFTSVPVDHAPRTEGRSNYTIGRLARHALNMMTGFSTWPLRAASLLGFGFTLLGVCILVFVVGVYLTKGGTVPGFSFLASVIAIFAGAQMFALGIIGEYLSRMHFRMMERPTYAVRDRIESGVQAP